MANEVLTRTPTSTGNRRVFTWAGWIKRNDVNANGGNTYQGLFSVGTVDGSEDTFMYSQDFIRLRCETGTDIQGSAKYRDVSSWAHVMMSVDTTLFEPDNRCIFYINGKKEDNMTDAGDIVRNALLRYNSIGMHYLGEFPRINNHLDGQICDVFFVDGQALTPDVFGFYKQGKGYISVGSTQATDFRPGQWVPKTPRVIKTEINRRGGFGVNGFYLPMNDSKNFGADFHCDPNSIITLNEKLPQPRVGVATTASVGLGYTDALRADPFAANLVLALPFVSGGLSSGFGDYAPSVKGSGSANVGRQHSSSATIVSGASSIGNYYGSSAYFDGNDIYDTGLTLSSSFANADFTIEWWMNANDQSGEQGIFGITTTSGGQYSIDFDTRDFTGNTFYASFGGSSHAVFTGIITHRNQWNHIAMVKKGSVGSLYLNGTAVGIKTNLPAASFTTGNLKIGNYYVDSGNYFYRGYIQDFRVYNTAKYTGGFDVPRPYTPVGISTWRAVPDCTANNFATLNAIDNPNSFTLTNGNLTGANATSNHYGIKGTVGFPTTGKYYYELRVDSYNTTPNYAAIGVAVTSPNLSQGQTVYLGTASNNILGSINNAGTETSIGTNPSDKGVGTILQVAYDAGNRSLWIGANNTYYSSSGANTGNPSSGTNATATGITTNAFPSINLYNATASINFGQNPTFSGNTTAGTFTDSNGKGLFKYQPPSGFLALCEDNLPTPAISDPGKHFKTMLYTGDGNNGRSIVGVGFTPDLVWIKSRNATGFHQLMDSVRGAGIQLYSNDTSAESAGLYQSSFDRDGFSINYNSSGATNNSGTTYAAWCWRAGAGTTSTNTNGSIPSVVSVNQDAGFSIVSWSGTGSVGTIGHGLGKTPAFRINKYRDSSTNWYVWHKSLAANEFLILNQTTAKTGSSSLWNNTLPTSTTISYTTATTGDRFIEYVWAEIEGFSKFGSWVSNANADGPFIYCGFKPALVICKTASGDVSNWVIADSSRSSVNDGSTSSLRANTSDTEATAAGGFTIDFLSNGFKLRQSGALNSTGLTNIFAAWAESPFTTANAK